DITTADVSDSSAGRDRSAGWDGVGDAPSDLDDPSEVGDHRPDLSDKTVGQDRSGPTTDTAMTRSEERLQVGTQQREAGRARMRKYVVTERVTQTVPVSHDEVRVVREPITDANRGPAMSGPAISEEEHEVVLNAETPVVAKETVAVERVRLDTTTVTGQETVSADVRKEQIELDDPTEVEAKSTGGKSRR
ncbi:MAG: YsnF/AvaK domain-containing protein, partial [Janthinobacterium lividum]